MTDTPSGIVLDLPHGPGNPRNSEGSFAALKNGRILFAYVLQDLCIRRVGYGCFHGTSRSRSVLKNKSWCQCVRPPEGKERKIHGIGTSFR